MKDPNDLMLFCPRCFASDEDGSWGCTVDRAMCENCGAGNSAVRIPRWAVKSIREQASWIGKRYYPHEEDREASAELQRLRRTQTSFPGRKAAEVPDFPGMWTVKQRTGNGRWTMMVVKADSAQAALDATKDQLPWFAKNPS